MSSPAVSRTVDAERAAGVTRGGRPSSRIVLGTSHLGSVLPDALISTADREAAFRSLDAILDAGCTALDLAASYQAGGTERLVGHWMASRRNRDRLFLIGKGGHPLPIVQPHRVTPSAITSDLHASLRRLKTERLDLYLLHRDDERAPLEALVEALAQHQRDGTIGAWGVSNWTHERIERIDAIARGAGVPGVAASSPHLSLLEWTSVPWKGTVSISGPDGAPAIAFYERTQLPVLAWSPLGRGSFSARGLAATDGTYGGAANLARKQRAAELARARGVTPAQIAIAYLASQPFPVFPIVAVSSSPNMKANLEALALDLSAADRAWLATGERSRP